MDIHKELKEEIHKAQQQYKYYADQHRVQKPSYQIGDKVWPCAKLDHQRFGPFTILAKINPVTFKLQLPSTMRIHPIFHVSMLEPYQISPLRGERPSPSPPIKIDDHEEFEVEHRAPIKVREFHKKNLMKPRLENMTAPRGTRRLRGR
ncbi:hypothetical protein KP509_36G002100 [Ceratopteris richardii]|uniref:Tf2-1-like SH3-like domain-containing protein n=1 Tax=Ceratopteris richardii TaxID=49495 RepID=A0A8T2Q8Y6_CERRI|nr:hypothetical protein KP509_36G002100 [Ceratopteris richardii]